MGIRKVMGLYIYNNNNKKCTAVLIYTWRGVSKRFLVKYIIKDIE
jgi:hypothetical protein